MDFEQHLTNYIDQISRGQGPEADNPKFSFEEKEMELAQFLADVDGLIARTDRQIAVRDRVAAQLAEQSR